MTDSIRTRRLNRRYRFLSDPSHAWLRVPMADIVALRLENDITHYSYTREWGQLFTLDTLWCR